jgi:hypothetical protein
MLKMLSEAVSPEGTLSLSITLPVNPVLVSVTFARADPPASKVEGVRRFPLIVKFAPTVTSMSAECTSFPLVPVIVTLYRPAGTFDVAVRVRRVVLVPPADSLTDDGVNNAVGTSGPAPTLDGTIEEVMLTGPVKPVLFRPIEMMIEEFEARVWLVVPGFNEKSALTEIVIGRG